MAMVPSELHAGSCLYHPHATCPMRSSHFKSKPRLKDSSQWVVLQNYVGSQIVPFPSAANIKHMAAQPVPPAEELNKEKFQRTELPQPHLAQRYEREHTGQPAFASSCEGWGARFMQALVGDRGNTREKRTAQEKGE